MQCLVDEVRRVDEGDGTGSLCLVKKRQEGSGGPTAAE
jgi:hypothetical protein